jgi:hypothetical protein
MKAGHTISDRPSLSPITDRSLLSSFSDQSHTTFDSNARQAIALQLEYSRNEGEHSMWDEEPIVIHSADRQFTVGALCFLRDEQGQVCAHEVLLVSFDDDNRRIYHVLVKGKVHRYREGDRRLLTGFEADFPYIISLIGQTTIQLILSS